METPLSLKVINKLPRALEIFITYLLWSWRLHSLGKRSVIGKCKMVRNSRTIAIGARTRILEDWRIADLAPSDSNVPKIRIGSNCNIMHNFQCNAAVGVTIQDYVLIAPRVFITDSDHVVGELADFTTRNTDLRSSPVVIEHNCWLGVNAVILKGVTIGHHSVVGANAVVTHSIPPNSIVGGVPAKPLR
jgi:acetyltransferase-like isoleucine patch superfamily enzyme